MRLICTSDTHSKHRELVRFPDGDAFIYAGDLMNSGRRWEDIIDFNAWLEEVPVSKDRRLIIQGNHDILFDFSHPQSSPKTADKAKSLITNGVCLLDEAYEIQGVKFYGSPWSPYFFGWGFNAHRGGDIKEYWDKIPEDTEVLITHSPPYGILDQIVPGKTDHLGCEELLKVVKRLPRLKYHIFGHIHGSRGQKIVRFDHGKIIDPCFVNAAFLNEKYEPHAGHGYFLLEV